MAGLRFDDGWEMIAFIAPHGTDDRNVVYDAADVGKPVGDGGAGLAVILKGAQAGDDGALHGSDVVTETDGVD